MLPDNPRFSYYSDAHCAIIVGDWEEPSGESRLKVIWEMSVETIRRLLAQDINARLVLAGPAVTPKDARKIEAAITEFGEALDYRGPVYGEEKERFY